MSAQPEMTAAVLQGRGELSLERTPTPRLGADDVLVEVRYCGVCGSDIHMTLEGWGQPGSIGGHEWTGVVADIGPGVTRWAIGDPVVGGPTTRCGTCRPCRDGRPSLCEDRDTPGTDQERGAFADYIAKPQAELLALPDDLDLRAAALTEPLAVALHGITLARLAPGDSVMVIGAGPIGQLVLAALRATGWTDVTVVEPAPSRQALARALGADPVRHPDELEVPSIAAPDRIVPGAVDVVLECSGHRSAMEAGLAQLRRAGRLVLVGAGVAAPQFDPNRILLNELTITGSFTYDAGGFDRALELLSSGLMPVDLLLEAEEVTLDGLLDVMQRLAAGEIAGKVLVTPQGGHDG